MTISFSVSPQRSFLTTDYLRSLAVSARRGTANVTSRMLALWVGISLGGGTALSMATTTAHGWWNLHFSELGTYSDFSGRAFNTTLIVTGLIIVAFAVRLYIDLRVLTTLSRWMTQLILVLFTSLGINLLAVGVIPLNSNAFLHDRAASGVTLSFLCLLILVVVRARRFSRRLLGTTVLTILTLAAVIVAFATGTINLAALEIVAFPLIIGWSSALVRCVHQDMAGDEAVDAADEPVADAAGERAVIVQAADETARGEFIVLVGATVARDVGAAPTAENGAEDSAGAHCVPGFMPGIRMTRSRAVARAIRASARPFRLVPHTRPAPGTRYVGAGGLPPRALGRQRTARARAGRAGLAHAGARTEPD